MTQQNTLNIFLESAVERHRIYLKRQAGEPKPWSNWEVYQKFFFCNVFRQYDKCSKWMIENIIPLNRWDLIILYRFISTYELYKEIEYKGIIEDLSAIENFLQGKKAEGGSLFNGCFLRNPRINGGWTETYKAPFYTIKEIQKQESRLKEIVKENSLESMVDWLCQFPGIAGFMGYEYACDFEYSSWFNPTDKYTWANPGPGAKRGMNFLIHGCLSTNFPKEEWLVAARRLYLIMKNVFNKEFPQEDFSMREVEHWLCEFQKFIKYTSMLNGGSNAKHRKYDGIQ